MTTPFEQSRETDDRSTKGRLCKTCSQETYDRWSVRGRDGGVCVGLQRVSVVDMASAQDHKRVVSVI
eukprot:gene32750-40421_t